MDRRQFILGISAVVGGALTPVGVQAISSTFNSVDDHSSSRSVLSKGDLAFLADFGDVIIPATDTKSASEVGVPDFINHQLSNVMSADQQKAFLKSFKKLTKRHADFTSYSDDKKVAVVSALDDKMWNKTEEAITYRQIKELVVIGYFTSEEGATKELYYDPIPGGVKEVPTSELSVVSAV